MTAVPSLSAGGSRWVRAAVAIGREQSRGPPKIGRRPPGGRLPVLCGPHRQPSRRRHGWSAILPAMSEKQVAEPQFRFFTSERLRAGAKSSAQIATMIRNGALVPIGRGVYVSPAVAREFAAVLHGDHILRAAAALVRNGPACAVSHQSAALLHRIDLIGEDVSEVTITTRNGGRRGHRHSVHTYSNGLSDAHITHKFGLPVTTAARTVADLARTLPYAEGVVAADSVLHHGLATAAELWQLAAEIRPRRGGYRLNRVGPLRRRPR
jgi:hypothetical protein